MSKYKISATVDSTLKEKDVGAAAQTGLLAAFGSRCTSDVTVTPEGALDADVMRDHALNQIQTIAYEALLGPNAERLEAGKGNPVELAMYAKLERVVNIAESQEPDEDWRPLMIGRDSPQEQARCAEDDDVARYLQDYKDSLEACGEREAMTKAAAVGRFISERVPEAADMSTSDGLRPHLATPLERAHGSLDAIRRCYRRSDMNGIRVELEKSGRLI